MSLARYKAKRDFRRTPEPTVYLSTAARRAQERTFVIQKHAARSLHYDFRLEMNGTLKSWAIPKGLPVRKGDKRLAVHVEDHPVDYASFEGSIPEGNYGAGTVMIWDVGIYDVAAQNPEAALRDGKLVVNLHGRKLDGEWTLIRIRSRGAKEENSWLIIKTDRDVPAISARSEDKSVQSGRTMKQIAAHEQASPTEGAGKTRVKGSRELAAPEKSKPSEHPRKKGGEGNARKQASARRRKKRAAHV